MRNCLFVFLGCCALIQSLVNASYAVEMAKKPNKYLNYLKSPSLISRSITANTPRYMHSPTGFQSSAYITPRQGIADAPSQSIYSGSMMTSASERNPSRIIIVRQPNSSKRSHYSSSSPYSSQYMPQASSVAPSISPYPYPSPYGYPAPPYMPSYNYQAPMTGSPFGSQMSSYSPLVASMIAAAQRVTQTQTNPYGNQYASSQMTPQYYPPYGMSPMQSPLYHGGFGYGG